jgi:Transposase DDE domain
MTVRELIKLIPDRVFQELAVETKVDAQVKKLSGEVIFKLILFSMLNSEKLSLRVMEKLLQSAQFKSFSGYDILDSKFNSIRDRICTINAEYFEKLFANIFSIYNKELKEEQALSKTDSTYVALAAKLFVGGMKTGDETTRFVKYSVNLKGSLPASVKIFTAQQYLSEDVALPDLIDASSHLEGNIVVFDRGIKSRKAFEKFTDTGKWFITRSAQGIRYKAERSKDIGEKTSTSTVTIISDQIGKLMSKEQKITEHQYRIIKATIDSSGEQICFVSNLLEEDAYLIAAWYKQRWEIEIFFKFIKQHLSVKHLVSRDENGIKVMLYMTMISAILILAYKKINKLKGYKITKLQFELELENELIREIVILCGGNPARAPHLFSSA